MEKQAAHVAQCRQGVPLHDGTVRDAVQVDGLPPCAVGSGLRRHAARDDLAHFHGLHYGRKSAVVIQVGVGYNHRIHAPVAPGAQEGHDDAGARVPGGRAGAAVDQQGAPVGTGNEDGVALSDVQDGDLKRPAGQQAVAEEQDGKGHQSQPCPPLPEVAGVPEQQQAGCIKRREEKAGRRRYFYQCGRHAGQELREMDHDKQDQGVCGAEQTGYFEEKGTGQGGEYAKGRIQKDQRPDEEIRDRRHPGNLVERARHHGQRAQLRRDRHQQPVPQPSGPPLLRPGKPFGQQLLHPGITRDDGVGREKGKLEAQVKKGRGPDQEYDDGRHGQDVDGVGLPVQLTARQEERRHDRGPDDRRRQVGDEGVQHQDAQRAGDDDVPRESHDEQQRMDHQGDQADVQSGNGQDMGQADRLEGVEQLFGQLSPRAEENAFQQGGGIAPHGPVD